MKESILNGWLWRRVINGTLCAVISVNLFVMVWGGETTPADRALFLILEDAICMVWMSFGESTRIRGWLMSNYLRSLWSLVFIDILLMPVFLYSAYAYMIVTILLVDGIYMLMFKTLVGEIKETFLENPNARNSYMAKSDKMSFAGHITGGVLSMFVPLAEMGVLWMMGGMVICSVSCAVINTLAMRRTLKYMRENDLQFHCVKKEAEMA